jgi:murein DD-endopeptidase MepM/ murein hydrolase activator NlpD
MKPPFSILVVHGDGSRLVRLRLWRWVAYGALASIAAVLAALLALSGERALLKRRLADQRELIDTFRARVAAVRGEIETWQALHATMWEAFEPKAASKRTGRGANGAAPVPFPLAAGIRPSPREELDLLATSVAEEGPRLRKLERVIRHTGRMVKALPLRWPVQGPINSEYGRRPSPWSGEPQQHEGIDIGTTPGTPVRSPAPGTVVAAGSEGDYGRHVTLDHTNGVQSLYGHLAKVGVKVGEHVEEGQVIGLVGSTGQSTGPHLHYEVLVEGKPVNPRGFLREP